MKKLLSMTLVLAMLIGILGVTPVSADLAALQYNLPYYFVDHEGAAHHKDGVTFTNHSNSELVEGGVNGSGYCAKITDPATQTTYDDCLIVYPTPGTVKGNIEAGGTLKLSFWVKLGQQMKENLAAFTLISPLTNGSTSYILDPATGTHPIALADHTSTEWQKITFQWTAPQACTIKNLQLRIANNGVINQVAGGSSSAPGERIYYIDDVEAVVYPAGFVMTDNVSAEATDYRMTFENNNSSIFAMVQGVGGEHPTSAAAVSTTSGLQTLQLVNNPDGAGKVLKWTEGSTHDPENSEVWIGTATTGYQRVNATVPAGGTLTYKFKYYFTQQMKDNNSGFCIAFANGNLFTGNVDKTPNVWHTATLTYTNDTDAAVTLTGAMFRPYNVYGREGALTLEGYDGYDKENATYNYGDRVFYIDDFCSYITAAGETKATVAPASTALTGSGVFAAGQQITLVNTFVPATGSTATDASLIRLVNTDANGKKASLGTYNITDTITVPALPAGGTVSIEVIPVDSNGLVGEAVSYPTSVVVAPETPVTLTLTDADNTASAEVSFGNTYTGATDVALYIAFYDANNRMIKGNIFSGTSAAEIPGELTYTAEDNVKFIKAFAWSNDGNYIPLVDSELIEK